MSSNSSKCWLKVDLLNNQVAYYKETMGVPIELEVYAYEFWNELNVALRILYSIAWSLQHFYCELANVCNQIHK